MSKDAKHWIISAGVCLLTLTGINLGYGQQLPVAPIPEPGSIQDEGLPTLTEPAPVAMPVAPSDIQAPAPETIAVPAEVAPQPVAQPMPAAQPQPVAQPMPAAQPMPVAQPRPAAAPQEPCQQCQQCPPGYYADPNQAYGQDSSPWWSLSLPSIRPVPYYPQERCSRDRGFGPGFGGPGFGGQGVVRDRWGRMVPIEGPFYTVRGPRDFYMNDPRPLGP